ncbi:Hypothetical predicted protein, partial [Pelobates cultripes]
ASQQEKGSKRCNQKPSTIRPGYTEEPTLQPRPGFEATQEKLANLPKLASFPNHVCGSLLG